MCSKLINEILKFAGVVAMIFGILTTFAAAQGSGQPTIFEDDFESDPFPRWTISRESTDPSTFAPRDWAWVQTLPDGRAGSAFFAADPSAFELCSAPAPGQAGVLLLESPPITLPGDFQGRLQLSFDHWVSLEEGFDGAQLMISLNGSPYFLVASESNAAFISNPYNFVLALFGDNPRLGQPAWSGVGGGLPNDSWGTTIVDLSSYAQPGDAIRLRWDMSTDYCFGTDAGWYVDNVKVNAVPLRTVTGTVTGNGEPVGGINVTAYQLSSEFSYWEPAQSTVTGSDGSYALSLLSGTYRIGFIDPDGPYGTVFFDGADNIAQADDVVVATDDVANIDANMALNHPITGIVSVDGVDMPGVAVTAWRQVPDGSGASAWNAVNFTFSQLDGTYSLYVPDGTYRVGFATWQGRWPPIYYDGALSLEFATDVVVAGAGVPNINAAFLSEVPDSGPAITGTVTEAGTGAPAGGVIASAWMWNGGFWAPVRSRETRPDGTYVLYIPEGIYRVQFEHPLNRYSTIFYDGAATVDAASDVIVTSDGAPNVNAQLVENHSISGTLTADAVPELPPGPPPTSITAWRWNAPGNVWDHGGSAFSAPDGTYVLYVPNGTYRIGFTPFGPYHPTYYDGSETLAEAHDVFVADGNISNINAHLRRIVFADPWPPATSLSGAGQDAWGPQVSVGPDGAVTAVWYRRDGRNSRVQVATLAPNEYWSPPRDLSLPGEDASDPQVAMGARGTAVVVWRLWDGAHYRVQASSRGQNGRWSAPATLSMAGEDAWDPQVAMGPHGMAVVAWRRSDGAGHQVLATTRVAYGPWSSQVMISTAGGDTWDPRVAVGSDGTATVVWSRSDGSNERVQATTRTPNGSWSSPVTLSDAGSDAWNPQVAVGSDGAATAVWRGSDGVSDRIQASSRPPNGLWSTPASLSTVSGNVHDPQVAVDPEGVVTAVWSWWNVDRGEIQTAARQPGGTWSRPVTLSNCCENAQAARVAAGPDGRATALWRATQDGGLYELMVAATRTPDGLWSAPIIVSEDSPRVYGAQVRAGSDGTVAAVWERRDGADDRVQAVVLIPVLESRRNQ